MKFPRCGRPNNYPRKRGKLLHHTGHVDTAKNVWIAKQVSLANVTIITVIGLDTLIHHSVHDNVGVHSFVYSALHNF